MFVQQLKAQGNFLFKYRSFLPLLILTCGLSVYVFNHLNRAVPYSGLLYDLICISISLFGLLIRVFAVGFSGDNTSGRNTAEGQIADEINKSGAYSLCRHPLYVGNFFMWLGIALFTQDLWFVCFFVLLYWLYYERIIFAEEAYLRDKYGEGYEAYSAGTPLIIPSVKGWKPAKHSFSWVKIIRQEKTGILNLCVVIFAFKSLGSYLDGLQAVNLNSYWLWVLVFGLVWYASIKLIQKNTNLLKIDR